MVDPVRLFIKNEPHKRSKLLEGRLRLISNVSLIDEVIDRLLFEPQNCIEIDNWLTCPSKPGIGFTDEMIADLHETVVAAHKSSKVFEGDLSAWDWTVQGWELEAEARMRIYTMGLPDSDDLAKLIRARITCVSHSVFVLSNGLLYSQDAPGIMLSGWYCTGSSNSRIGKLLSTLAGSTWSVHMGDDFLAHGSPEFENIYRSFGHKLKVFKPIDLHSYEFCSMIYPKGIPVNIWKTFVRLLSHSPVMSLDSRRSLFDQWCFEMRNSPHMSYMKELILKSRFLEDGGSAIVDHASKETNSHPKA